MVSAVCGGVRVVSIYAPNGRALDTPFYQAKLAWFERLARWLRETQDPAQPLVIGGDFNVAPRTWTSTTWPTLPAPRTSRRPKEPRLRRSANGV